MVKSPHRRSSSACERCRRHKIRCTGSEGQCDPCVRASSRCNPQTNQRHARKAYLRSLKEKLAALEAHKAAIPAEEMRESSAASFHTASSTSSSVSRLTTSRTTSGVAHSLSPTPVRPGLSRQKGQHHDSQSTDHSSQCTAVGESDERCHRSLRVTPPTEETRSLGHATKQPWSQTAARMRANPTNSTREGRWPLPTECSLVREGDVYRDSPPHSSRPRRVVYDKTASPRGRSSPSHSRSRSSCSTSLEEQHCETGSDMRMPSRTSLSGTDTTRITDKERHQARELFSDLYHPLQSQMHNLRGAALGLWDRSVVNQLYDYFFDRFGGLFSILHEAALSEYTDSLFAGRTYSPTSVIPQLVVAISLRSMANRAQDVARIVELSHECIASAYHLLDFVMGRQTVERLQVVLLLLLHSLLVPGSENSRALRSMALQFALELNLYSEDGIKRRSGTDYRRADICRRLFWSTYAIDRWLCLVNSSPPSLSDEWITTALPRSEADCDITPEGLKPGASPCVVKTSFHQYVALRRLQSDFGSLVSNNPTQSPATMRTSSDVQVSSKTFIADMRTRLCAWRDACLRELPMQDESWITLQYHVSLAYLSRSLTEAQDLDHEGMHIALHAGEEVAKAYQSLERENRIDFPWMASLEVYASGEHLLWSFSKLAAAGRVCSRMSFARAAFHARMYASVLAALSMTEDWRVRHLCDDFDAVTRSFLERCSHKSTRNSRLGRPCSSMAARERYQGPKH